MGHEIIYNNFSCRSYTKDRINNICNNMAKKYGDYGYGLPYPIEFMDGCFNSREEAENYLKNRCDSKSYGEMAVKYRNGRKSKKVEELYDKLNKARNERDEFAGKPYATTVKSEFIGCKRCMSKLNRKYIMTTNKCPLCDHDFRSETTLNRIKSMNDRLSKINEELKQELAKTDGRGEEFWLVRYEYHV